MHTVFDRFLVCAFKKTDKVANGSLDFLLLFGLACLVTAFCFMATGVSALKPVAFIIFILCAVSAFTSVLAESFSGVIRSLSWIKVMVFGGTPLVFQPDKPKVIKALAKTFTNFSKIPLNRPICTTNFASNRYCVKEHVSVSRPAFCRAPRAQKRSTSSSSNSGDDDSSSSDPSDPSQQLIPLAPRSPFLKLKNSAFVRQSRVNTPLLVGACLDGGCPA